MKKLNLDLRTAVVMLAIFAVGYATALALQPSPALALGDRLEFEEIVADRIIARESIESAGTIGFVDGFDMDASEEYLRLKGRLLLHDGNTYHSLSVGNTLIQGKLAIGGYEVITSARQLNNIRIGPGVMGGTGLDVGSLGGHPAHHYVLWSDLESLKVRLPRLR